MPGSCAVTGCRSRFVRGGKHFYRFPHDEEYKKLWIQFTRKGPNFSVKKCSAICEDHFTEDRVVAKKKGRMYLLKKTVPTVYYRETKAGVEKIVVEFDDKLAQYVGQESANLLRGTVRAQEQKRLLRERNQKVKELKGLCRFCFESQDDKFVAINKLEAYSIDPDEMLSLIGIGSQHNEVFSEIVCEQCFQQIVSIDGYRKRCFKAQEEVITEMQEFDMKLQTVCSYEISDIPWFKFEEMEEEDEPEPTHVEILEEYLDDISYIGEEEDDTFKEEQNDHDTVEYTSYKLSEIPIDHIIVKDEDKMDTMDDIMEHHDFEAHYDNNENDEDDDEFQGMPEPNDKDIYNITDVDTIIKNPDRNSFALRIYECFFCRLRFAGKKTFKAHECHVKEVKCEVEGCDKFFNKLSGYNTHVVKVHGLLKTSKHFCPICKNVVMSTENQFKLHRRQCNKESERKDSDNPIECEICKKKCQNLKSYTVHKLFHDSRNLIGAAGDRGNSGLYSKGPVICELCGKEFTNAQGLRTHKKNVHRVGQPKDIVYQCDICSKMRPTKRSLFNHMRNVHRVRETPCNVCGKVFRTPALLQKHMMYHDETKRIHRCPMCPDKPGWFTNVALKRHQKSHHLGLKDYQCDFPYCDAAFTNNSMLKQHKATYHGHQL